MTLDEIKRLIEFRREQDVTEFELDYDGVKLRVKSGAATHAVSMMPAMTMTQAPPVMVGQMVPAAPAPPPASAGPETPEEGTELAIVKSPIDGTFYRAAEPGAKPLVSVGDSVDKVEAGSKLVEQAEELARHLPRRVVACLLRDRDDSHANLHE